MQGPRAHTPSVANPQLSILVPPLLKALNKVAPKEGAKLDARPVRAEDADTGSWCKALARTTAPSVRDTTGPQQLGVGVSGGVELYGIGFKVRF